MDKKLTDSYNWFFNMTPTEITLLSFAIALVLSDNLDERQRAFLANFLQTVGATLTNLTPGAWAL